MSETDTLRQRHELVLLSAELQRSTIARRLGRIQANPVRVAAGMVANAASRPLVWRLGAASVAFAWRAFRKRSTRRRKAHF